MSSENDETLDLNFSYEEKFETPKLVFREPERFIPNFPIEQLVPSTVLPHRQPTQETIESIKRDGIKHALLVTDCLTDQTKKEIVDGNQRYETAKKPDVNIKTVSVNYIPYLTKEEIFEYAYTSFRREDLTQFQKGEMYQKMMEQMNMTQKQLAQWLSRRGEDTTQETISNYVKIVPLKQHLSNYKDLSKLTKDDLITLLKLIEQPQDLNEVLRDLDLRLSLDGGLTHVTVKDFVKRKMTEIENRIFNEIAPSIPIPPGPPTPQTETDRVLQELQDQRVPVEKAREIIEERIKEPEPVQSSKIQTSEPTTSYLTPTTAALIHCPKCGAGIDLTKLPEFLEKTRSRKNK